MKVFQNNLFGTPILPNNNDTMLSSLNVTLNHENYNLSTGIESYENLGIKQNDRYQFVFPYYDFNRNILNEKINGSVVFYSSGNNSLVDTNILKTTIINDIEYNTVDYFTNSGLKNNFSLYLKNLNSVGKNDTEYTSSPQLDGMSIIKLDTEFPLSKSNKKISENLTPKISFRVNPGNNMNKISGQKLIDANNVFNINRLGINESFEAGKSLTLGLDYRLSKIENDFNNKENNEEIKEKYFEFKLATVLRDTFESDIPASSTLNKKSSDIFGSINNNLLENINLSYDFSLDNNMKTINSNSIGTELTVNNFVTKFHYIEQRFELGTTHILSNETEYKANDNHSIKFSTRRNKEIDLTEYYDLSYEYKNDCLTAALKFNKVFYKDNDLVPSEDLFFTITLIPLTTYEREIYKRNSGWLR